MGVARNADVVDTATLGWYAATGGTFYAGFTPGEDLVGPRILSLDGGVGDRVADINRVATAKVNVFGSNSASVTGANNSLPVNTFGRIALGFALNDYQLYTNGTAATPDTATTAMKTPTSFTVGADFSNGNQLNGHIKEIRYYNERKPNQVLKDMSEGNFPEQKFFLAITRRTAKQMRPKQRMAKPTRGLFR